MNTWKIFITFILILVTLPNLAQTLPVSLEVRGGINISDVDMEFESSSRVNYRFETVVDYNFANNMFIRSGLTFSDKKVQIEDAGIADYNEDGYIDFYYSETKLSARYVQAPIMVGYKLNINNLKLNAVGGAYFAYGLGGNAKNKTPMVSKVPVFENGQIIDYHTTVNFITSEGKTFKHLYDRFDTGLILSIGAEYRRLTLNAGYEYGLINIAKDNSDIGKIKTRNAFVTLGFRIL